MSEITPQLAKELRELLDYCPPRRLNRNLRKLFMEYLFLTTDLPPYFEDLVIDLDALMNFLDFADEERRVRSVS